jgi:hypothetical protein
MNPDEGPNASAGGPQQQQEHAFHRVLGVAGANRVRWVGMDFGPCNTAIALIEVDRMPPDYVPYEASPPVTPKAIDRFFRLAMGEKVPDDSSSASSDEKKATQPSKPWIRVLISFKINLERDIFDRYVDKDFAAELATMQPPVQHPPKFAQSFDCRTRMHANKEQEEDVNNIDDSEDEDTSTGEKQNKKKKKAKKKGAGEEKPEFIPTVEISRGVVYADEPDDGDSETTTRLGKARGRCEVLSYRLGRFFASEHMHWLFAEQWPIVFENQVDHIKPRTPNANMWKKKRGGEPFNWAEALNVVCLVSALDRVYGHPMPRYTSYVAKKYGLAERIARFEPYYDKFDEEKQKDIRKKFSIAVMNDVITTNRMTEFGKWFAQLRRVTRPGATRLGEIKQDDVADAVLMAVNAIATRYQTRRQSAKNAEKTTRSLERALSASETEHTQRAPSTPAKSKPNTTPSNPKKRKQQQHQQQQQQQPAQPVVISPLWAPRDQSVLSRPKPAAPAKKSSATSAHPRTNTKPKGKFRAVYASSDSDAEDIDDDDDDAGGGLYGRLLSSGNTKPGRGTAVLYDTESNVDRLDGFNLIDRDNTGEFLVNRGKAPLQLDHERPGRAADEFMPTAKRRKHVNSTAAAAADISAFEEGDLDAAEMLVPNR